MHSSREENEALRREIETQRREIEVVRADMAQRNAENELLRQNSSAQQSVV